MGAREGGSFKKESLEIEAGSLTRRLRDRVGGGRPDGQVLPIVMESLEIN